MAQLAREIYPDKTESHGKWMLVRANTGNREVRLSEAVRIAEVTGVSLDYLMGKTDYRTLADELAAKFKNRKG